MKFYKIFIFLFILFYSFCSNPNEVLVEFTNGDKKETILRKDLQFILKLNNLHKKEELSVATQSQILDELAFLSIGKLAFDSLPDLKKQDIMPKLQKSLIMLDERAFLNAINLILQDKSSDFQYKFINIQLLFLKKDPNMDRNEEANTILKELNDTKSEEEIEKIIFQKSENLRYKILGGLVDPICFNCGQNPIENLTNSLLDEKNKDKKFILVEDSSGYWIVRNLGVKEISEPKLKNIYQDYHKKSQFSARKFLNNPNYTKDIKEEDLNTIKQQILLDEKQIENLSEDQAKHQINLLKRNSLVNHMEEIQKKYNFKLNEETIKAINGNPLHSWDEEWEIFQFNNQSYKIKNLFDEIRKQNVDPKELTFNEVAPLLNQVYISYIVLQKSLYANDTNEYTYIFKDLITKQIFTNYYIQKELENLKISNQEIQQYYDLRKNNEFKIKKGNSETIIPLSEVKDRIEQTLLAEKRQSEVTKIKQELFKKYNVKIFKEKLKEGKV